MVLPTRLVARTGSSLLHKAGVPAAKSFTTRATTGSLYTTTLRQPSKINRSARFFSHSAVCKDQTQPAPNAKAYLESGVIKGTENPVNVKKVLVIGSGGLSIGQAGEFDYSGMLSFISRF
jgi:carbamoyl-phosphate synthase large subunit